MVKKRRKKMYTGESKLVSGHDCSLNGETVLGFPITHGMCWNYSFTSKVFPSGHSESFRFCEHHPTAAELGAENLKNA